MLETRIKQQLQQLWYIYIYIYIYLYSVQFIVITVSYCVHITPIVQSRHIL